MVNSHNDKEFKVFPVNDLEELFGRKKVKIET